jgi:Tol biopolymer transport system component
MQWTKLDRIAIVGAVAVLVSVPAVAAATTPGTNGQITFRRYFNQDQTKSAVFTMAADGTNVRQITHPPKGTNDDQADWAPDGRSLVFTRNPADGPLWLEVVGADGTATRRVTPVCAKKPAPHRVPAGCEDASEPSFAPDGEHVTYARATGRIRTFKKFEWDQIEHAAVAVIGVDGTGEREILRLPRYSGDVHYPQLSPDGCLIVFERVNSPLRKPKLGHALFVMRADGTGLHRITPWSLSAGDNPDWAPDGSRILFRSKVEVDDERSQYFTVRPDGTGLTQVTHFPFTKRRLFSASFSPDGEQIVFGKADSKGRGDVWAMNSDGSDPHPVLTARPWDSGADWGSAPN